MLLKCFSSLTVLTWHIRKHDNNKEVIVVKGDIVFVGKSQ